VKTLRRSGITAEINQFHYYPDGRVGLGRHTFDPQFPGIIGEFATATSDVWPDLADDRQGIAHRLDLAAELGYPLVLPWSFRAHDRHTSWSESVEQDVRSFTASVGVSLTESSGIARSKARPARGRRATAPVRSR
jgi:hypothetical protein